MDTFGNDLSSGGVVLSRQELIKKRQRNGLCSTCGQKCFKKKLFKLEPITITGKVLAGRCLICKPQDPNKEQLIATCAVVVQQQAPSSSSSRSQSGRGRGQIGRSVRGQLAASMPANSNSVSLPPAATTNSNSSNNNNNAGSTSSSTNNNFRSREREALPTVRSARNVRTDSTVDPGEDEGSLRSSNPLPRSTYDNNNNDHAPPDPNSPRSASQQRSNEVAAPSPRERGNDDGNKPCRRLSLTKSGSVRQDSFLNRPMPRPSAIFLEGINIDDLWDDDDDADDNGDGGREYDEQRRDTDTSHNSAMSRLTSGERKALRALNSSEAERHSFSDIVTIMMMNSTSATVQNEGLHALSCVHDPKVALLEECAGSCGFEVIISAMGKCSKDAMAQTNACKVLFIASASSVELQIAIADAGGVETLVDAMKEFDDDVIVLEGCLLALSNLCVPEENLHYALEVDLIELTVNAMSKNVENCGLQEHGCACIANLSVHDAARKRVRDCGGCDTVVVSMVVNPMDVGVQLQALVALRNLCVRDDENKVLLANAGAIDVVIQAMQNHRDDPQIQAGGAWVLGIIGMNEDNKLYIGENGGTDVIIRAMWVHGQDVPLQEKAARALWTISVHPQNRYTMVEVDAIAAVIASMQNHVAEPNIQERGLGVLANLAANDDDFKIQIVDEGALEVIVMTMVLHGENEPIQERAVALLYKLCIRENIPKMVNANVCPMMAVVAETFPICEEKASYVLRYLSVS